MHKLTFVLLTAYLLISSVGPVRAQADAQALIGRAIKAHGGPDKLTKLKVARITVTGTLTDPSAGELPFTLKDAWALPGQYRTENHVTFHGMKMSRTMGLNGNRGWTAFNDRVQEMDKATFEEMKEQVYAESLDKLFPLLESRRFQLSLGGETDIDGHKASGVKVASAGHREVRLYFDNSTGHLLKRAEKIQGERGQEVLREVVFSDYQPLDGVLFPMKIVGYYDGKKVIEGKVVEIKFYGKLDKTLFEKP